MNGFFFRLASVQEQRLPCSNAPDGRLSPSTETPPVTPSSTHSKVTYPLKSSDIRSHAFVLNIYENANKYAFTKISYLEYTLNCDPYTFRFILICTRPLQ